MVSVLIALFVGSIEALSLIGDKLNLANGFWHVFTAISNNIGALGYAVIALFVLIWTTSWAIEPLQRA